jgi:4-hydroxybenzoate polyprenyltransferase
MGLREMLEFVKVEHTLFSLPFVLIGFVLADNEFGSERLDVFWIIVAAIGARGLAMALNRIIDREIDSANPRTASRHLPSGTMSIQTAWVLSAAFLVMLLFSAWMLNEVALKMVWLPVIAFVIYPYTKRISWICHFWIGFCLALAPAGAWVAIAADTHGWAAITGMHDGWTEILWFPELFFISLGVALWISAFDVNYALMDEDVDRDQGIRSFPASFGHLATRNLSVALTIGWMVCFLLTGMHEFSETRRFRHTYWILSVVAMGLINIYVMTKGAESASESADGMDRYQKILFRSSMLTGWFLLASMMYVEYFSDGLLD